MTPQHKKLDRSAEPLKWVDFVVEIHPDAVFYLDSTDLEVSNLMRRTLDIEKLPLGKRKRKSSLDGISAGRCSSAEDSMKSIVGRHPNPKTKRQRER